MSIVLYIGVVLIAVLFQYLTISADKQRIEDYYSARGLRVELIKWQVFSFSVMASKYSRHYEVSLIDPEGRAQFRECKTNMIIGVYEKN